MNYKSSKSSFINLFFGSLIALCLLLPATAQALIYAADSEGRVAGNLYLVNPYSGTVATIGPITDGVTDYPVTGLAFDGAGVLWGVTGSRNLEPRKLLTIDPATGAATVVGDLLEGATIRRIPDITFSGGTLYGWSRDGSDLVSINTTTGAVTTIGAANNTRRSIAADGAGTVYVAISSTGNTLDTVDTGTGVRTPGPTITGGLNRLNSMSFYGGTLFAVDSTRNQASGTANLVTIDTATGALTTIITGIGTGSIDALAGIVVDTEPDGMDDDWEQLFGLIVGVDDSAGDGDGDGLSNLDEFLNGADPTNPDTDGDGLTDGDEVNTHGTDPTNADTDNDQIDDGAEIAAGANPLDESDGLMFTVTNDGQAAGMPDAGVDSNGNVHLVWAQAPAGSGSGNWEIYYKMLAPDGVATLIDSTKISDADAAVSARPSIAVDSGGRVIVVWNDKRLGSGGEVFFVRVEPGLDNQDGSAADPLVIVTVTETLLSTDDVIHSTHPRIAVDAAGDLHIVWYEYSNGGKEIVYTKRDPDGIAIVANTVLHTASYTWRAEPDIAVGADGKVHIVWSTSEGIITQTGQDAEVFYTLLDNGGNVLIAPTQISIDDDITLSRKATVSLAPNGKVNVVWQEGLYCCSATTPRHFVLARLDPSLDNQDGSAADPAVIKVLGDTVLPTDAIRPRHPYARTDALGTIHISYQEGTGHPGNPTDVRYMAVSNAGNVLDARTLSASAQEPWSMQVRLDASGRYMVFGAPTGVSGVSELKLLRVFGFGFRGARAVPVVDDDGNCLFFIWPTNQSPWGLAIVPLLLAGIWLARRRRS